MRWLALALAGLSIACGGDKPPFRGPQLDAVSRVIDVHYPATKVALDNGLSVYLLANPRAPLVRIDARYRVGADVDPTPGLAHLAEHLSFKLGGDAALERRLATAAVTYNAFTSWESTHYMAVGSPDKLGELLAIEAGRLAGGCSEIDPAVFAREREAVRNELRRRDSAASAPIREAIYPVGHPRQRPLGGTEQGIAAIELGATCRFIDTHYQPSQLTLVVSGNFAPAAVERQVRERFGVITGRNAPAATRPPPTAFAGRTVEITAAVDEAGLVLVFPMPSPTDPARALARLNASAMISYASELESEHEWIEDIDAAVIDGGSYPLWAVVFELEDVGKATRATELFFERRKKYLADIANQDERFDSTAALLDEVLHERRRQLIDSVATIHGRALELADRLQFAGHPHGVTPELRELSAITRAGVIENAATVLRRESALAIAVKPATDRPPSQPLGALTRDVDLAAADLAADSADASRPLAGIAIEPPKVIERTLDNGLRTLIAPGFDSPLVEIRAVFAHPATSPAIAEASAALLGPDFDKEYTSVEQIETLWSTVKMGGRRGQSAAMGSTTFRLSGLAAFADGLVWRLGWILDGGGFTKKSVARRNKRRGKEARARKVSARRFELLYGPRHTGAMGRGPVSKGQLERWKRDHYRASGGALVIAGKLDPAKTSARVDRVFGRWARGKPTTPAKLAAPVRRDRPVVLLWEDASRRQPTIDITAAVPPGDKIVHAERLIAADMLEQSLFAIRRELGASYGFSVSYEWEVDRSWFRIRGGLATERARRAASELVSIASRQKDVTPDRRSQFVRARRRLVLQLVDAMSHPAGLARQLEHVAENGLGVHYWPSVAQSATVATIERISPAVDLSSAVIVVRGPAEALRAITAGLGAVTTERVD